MEFVKWIVIGHFYHLGSYWAKTGPNYITRTLLLGFVGFQFLIWLKVFFKLVFEFEFEFEFEQGIG